MFRLLDENMLVVYVIDNVYVPVLGVDLEDDGFDGGVAMYEYALSSARNDDLVERE